jgi:hypothetical protein
LSVTTRTASLVKSIESGVSDVSSETRTPVLPEDAEEEPVARTLGRLDEPDDLVARQVLRELPPRDRADRAGDEGERA